MANQTDTLARLAMARMARVDPVPYDPRTGQEFKVVRVEIDSRTDGQAIPGHLVAAGKGVYELYENQVESVESLCEMATQAELDAVQRDLEHHKAECLGQIGDKPENKRNYLPSFEASFRRLMHRDILPFRSVELLATPKQRKATSGG
ncbi:MAG: hypothetical protein ACE5EV_08895 [Gaiellales bacterium]